MNQSKLHMVRGKIQLCHCCPKTVDSNAVLEVWTEGFCALLIHHTPSMDEFIEDLPILPTIHVLDETPTLDDVTKACKPLKNGKAVGPDERRGISILVARVS